MVTNLKKHERIAQEKLMEVKATVEVFGMDYDGTLADGEKYQKEDAISIIKEILEKGKTPAFITGRAATAVKLFVPPLKEYYKELSLRGSAADRSNLENRLQRRPSAALGTPRNDTNFTATYIGAGNGTVLYRVDARGVERIYNHGLSLEEVLSIVAAWESFSKENLKPEDLSEKGITTFKKFYADTWENLIPEEVLNIGRPFEGRIFTEEAKVTFVLPKDISRHQKVVDEMQKLIGQNFSVAAGDKDFCHITKRLEEDSKKVAIKSILEILKLNENQVATFGDMPHGNDAGLLSFPYSFTNYVAIADEKSVNDPPFILPGSTEDPVGSVHKAVRLLLS
jgi:hydroxymethylpyrimidine pyrophosphatase-like HAD family hydrolase